MWVGVDVHVEPALGLGHVHEVLVPLGNDVNDL